MERQKPLYATRAIGDISLVIKPKQSESLMSTQDPGVGSNHSVDHNIYSWLSAKLLLRQKQGVGSRDWLWSSQN